MRLDDGSKAGERGAAEVEGTGTSISAGVGHAGRGTGGCSIHRRPVDFAPRVKKKRLGGARVENDALFRKRGSTSCCDFTKNNITSETHVIVRVLRPVIRFPRVKNHRTVAVVMRV